MKNYKVEATMRFTDKEENTKRNVGDIFEVTEARYNFLKKNNAVKLVGILEIEKVEYSNLEDQEPKEIEIVVTNEFVEESNEEVEEKPKKKKNSKK